MANLTRVNAGFIVYLIRGIRWLSPEFVDNFKMNHKEYLLYAEALIAQLQLKHGV